MNVTDGASEETIVVAPYWPGEGYGGGTKVASMEEAIAEAKHLAKQGYGKGKSIIHIVRTTRTVIEWNSDHSDLAALRRPEPAEDAVERVARAIYDSMFAPHERCWGEDPWLRERYMDTARAALAAMPAPQTGEVAVVRCPCCEGYRDRGDGTEDHCGVCDDEGEVSPERAAEYRAAQEPAPDRAQEQEGGA